MITDVGLYAKKQKIGRRTMTCTRPVFIFADYLTGESMIICLWSSRMAHERVFWACLDQLEGRLERWQRSHNNILSSTIEYRWHSDPKTRGAGITVIPMVNLIPSAAIAAWYLLLDLISAFYKFRFKAIRYNWLRAAFQCSRRVNMTGCTIPNFQVSLRHCILLASPVCSPLLEDAS